jgi:hypothetical protein
MCFVKKITRSEVFKNSTIAKNRIQEAFWFLPNHAKIEFSFVLACMKLDKVYIKCVRFEKKKGLARPR